MGQLFCRHGGDDDWNDKHDVVALKIFFNATEEQVRVGLDLMHADSVLVKCRFDRMAVEFLYAKNLVGHWFGTRVDRLDCVPWFFRQRSVCDPADALLRRRLQYLLAPGQDSTCCQVPEKVQSFDAALKILHKWEDEREAYIFTRDHTLTHGKDIIKQRVCSGLCTMQSVAMLRHYLKVLYEPSCEKKYAEYCCLYPDGAFQRPLEPIFLRRLVQSHNAW